MASVKKTDAKASKGVEQLNRFLHGELSAVETYKVALDNLESASRARTSLEVCLKSHQQRVSLLRQRISELGAEPEHGAAVWSAIGEMIESGELPEKAAVVALDEGELHSLADYRGALAGLDASARSLVETELLPKQQQSCHAIDELKQHLH